MKIGDPSALLGMYIMHIGTYVQYAHWETVWRYLKKENMSIDNRMSYCDCVFYCDSIKFIVLKNVPAPSVHHSFIYNS